jgi:hypothetical protein
VLTAFREKYRFAADVAFFVLGFLFDLAFLQHIDSRPMLIQQGTYLVLLTVLIGVDHRLEVGGTEPTGFWGKLLGFREWLLHFFLGTLLNASLIFYFKSASSLLGWDVIFLAAIAALLVLNELPRFRALGPMVRVALLSFVTTSYLTYLLPVLFGFLSIWLFLAAVALGAGLTVWIWKAYASFTRDPHWTFRRAVLPGLLCQALVVTLYLAHVLPPVPLSLRFIGVYHDVLPEGPRNRLFHLSAGFRFWSHGDVLFRARPGDRVTMFARIFAPRNFRDRLDVRWAYHDRRAGTWRATDAIPLTITGGLDEGWRAVAYKDNYQPGEWRVQVETQDHRVVGHLRFTIVEDPTTDPREFVEEVR